jgi:hypothetical protein
VQLGAGVGGGDLLEEAQELLVPVIGVAGVGDLPGGDVERGGACRARIRQRTRTDAVGQRSAAGVQLFNPATGSLSIVTQSGFGSEFLEYFAVVDDDHSACGRAAKARTQTVIADVTADAGFERHREIAEIAAASGFRSVVSTPLMDYSGHLIGMVRAPTPPVGPGPTDHGAFRIHRGAEAGRAAGRAQC